MLKNFKIALIVVMSITMIAGLSLFGCKSSAATEETTAIETTAAETTVAETAAEETTAEETTAKLIPEAEDIILNGTVFPRSDDIGPEGDTATKPSDVSLGGKTIQDYIDMARSGKIEAPQEIIDQVKDKMKAAIVMHGLDQDWPQMQIKGISMLLEAFGVKIVSVTGGEWDATKQIENIETVMQLKPDVVLSIPVDQTVEGPAYRDLVNAGIKLVLLDMIPGDLTYKNGDYISLVACSSRGNGTAAADIMAKYFADMGLTQAKVGVMRLNFLHQVTEERALGFENRCKQYYPWIDTSVKVDFDFAEGAYGPAEGTLTANPDLNGFFAVWEFPALQIADAARAAGIDPAKFVITTSDLSEGAALEIASNQFIKGLGAQDPFAQGIAEGVCAIKGFLGEEVPPFIAIPGYAVTKDNVLDAYKLILQKEPPDELKKFFK